MDNEQHTTRLSEKGQTTIPAPIRKILSLSSGDEVLFEVKEDTVTLRKAQPVDILHLKALQSTLSEWDSPEDNEAYNDL